ncbi:hypothetical protein FRB94_006861 [Tulasnella sp. JGI-2019a]|nr:hypothetical protein FRB94_006861 [Tulasnella sp. JGI-2019a]KAG9017779.1 hypothetical protein FRB93_004590 [Tulasnella sp. JGI-2019a]
MSQSSSAPTTFTSDLEKRAETGLTVPPNVARDRLLSTTTTFPDSPEDVPGVDVSHPLAHRFQKYRQRRAPTLHRPRYLTALCMDIQDVALFGDMYRAVLSWRGAVAPLRLVMKQVLPGVAPILLSKIPLTTSTGSINVDVVNQKGTSPYLGSGIALFIAPMIEKVIFNGNWMELEPPPGLSTTAQSHIREAFAQITEICESLAGIITTVIAAAFILGGASGPGPMLAVGIGALLAMLMALIFNVNVNTALIQMGIPSPDTYHVEESKIDEMLQSTALRVQFGCSGGMGLAGLFTGALVGYLEYHHDAVNKSAWLVNTYVPALSDFFQLETALLQFNSAMHQSPKSFILVKADFARQYKMKW